MSSETLLLLASACAVASFIAAIVTAPAWLFWPLDFFTVLLVFIVWMRFLMNHLDQRRGE